MSYHPDRLFGEARLAMESSPYVRAMDKFRAATKGTERVRARQRREMLLAEPERFGLAEDEIAAVAAVHNG